MEKEQNNRVVVSRIARDISDGIILLDTQGVIQYINPSALQLLGNYSLKEGVSYGQYMAEDGRAENDAFHQYVLDCIYDKQSDHLGSVTYTRPDGGVRYLSIETSYAHADDALEKTGVIMQFSDVTELHVQKIKHNDTIKILVALTAVLAVWNYVYMLWKMLGEPIPDFVLTLIVEGVGVIGTAFALRYTSITWEEFGLGVRHLKKAVAEDSILTLSVLFIMILAKIAARLFLPGIVSPGEPFFQWNVLSVVDLLYIPNVILQEFLTRGVIQGSLDRILPENYPPAFSIIVSSLFFGGIHLHKGLVFMVGAALLLAFFGFLYRRQKTIWGLCIPHIFLSWSLRIIWGVVQ